MDDVLAAGAVVGRASDTEGSLGSVDGILGRGRVIEPGAEGMTIFPLVADSASAEGENSSRPLTSWIPSGP
jgi:hypothetical protein